MCSREARRFRVGEPRRRGGRQHRDEPVLRELPHPVAEVARREGARGDDQAGAGRRVVELRLHDPGEDEIAERPVSVPTLVAVLDDRALRRRSGIDANAVADRNPAASADGARGPVSAL